MAQQQTNSYVFWIISAVQLLHPQKSVSADLCRHTSRKETGKTFAYMKQIHVGHYVDNIVSHIISHVRNLKKSEQCAYLDKTRRMMQ